jgi:hypothetical protein
MSKAMTQARKAGKAQDKVPLVVIHKTNTHHDGDLVVMRMVDFAMFGPMLEHLRLAEEKAALQKR